jgi:hypothetical protein
MLKFIIWLFHKLLLLTYLANLLKYLLLYVEKYDRFDIIDNMEKELKIRTRTKLEDCSIVKNKHLKFLIFSTKFSINIIILIVGYFT